MNYNSYIMDAYIKFLEASGARTIPIVYQGNITEILEKIDHINGVLFPGGGSDQDDFLEMGR